MTFARLLSILTAVQALLAARVVLRLATRMPGSPIRAVEPSAVPPGSIGVVVPVLNESTRLGRCLDGLIAQDSSVGEILVVDGGSTDATRELVAAYAARDRRVRLVHAAPVRSGWNGKAWGLEVGRRQAARAAAWLLTIDADVRPSPALARSLAAYAARASLAALSVATRQHVSGWADALVHPALLTTLVYRLGSPGRTARRIEEVQANGQCFLFRQDVLVTRGGFRAARASRCEDLTIARHLVSAGHAVGFYETDGLVSVKMYESWREAWHNWPRSLPLRDQFVRAASLVWLFEVTLVQALPIPLLLLLLVLQLADRSARRAVVLNALLAAVRIGVLVGTARAYVAPPWTYWLSPLCDLPAVVQIWRSVPRRRHVWRGRVLVDRDC